MKSMCPKHSQCLTHHSFTLNLIHMLSYPPTLKSTLTLSTLSLFLPRSSGSRLRPQPFADILTLSHPHSLLVIPLVSTSHHTLTPSPTYLGFPFSSSAWSPPPITPSHPHPLTWDFPFRHLPGLHLPSHPHTHIHLLGISLFVISLVSSSRHTLTPSPTYLGFPFSSSPWSPPPITPSHPHPLTWDFPFRHLPGLLLPLHPHTHTHLLGISLFVISLVSSSHYTLTPSPTYLGFPFSSSAWSPPPITPSHPHPLTRDFPFRHLPGLLLPLHPHTHTHLLGISLFVISLVSSSHHTLEDSSQHSWVDA